MVKKILPWAVFIALFGLIIIVFTLKDNIYNYLSKMIKEERLQLIGIIRTEQEKLTKKVTELKELTGSVTPDDAIGRISRMDAIHNNSIVKASITNLENRLDMLAMAIRMSDNPDFGTCTACHQPIPYERLKLRPEIRLCANCMKR